VYLFCAFIMGEKIVPDNERSILSIGAMTGYMILSLGWHLCWMGWNGCWRRRLIKFAYWLLVVAIERSGVMMTEPPGRPSISSL
jgi:hypothetical protein